MRRLCCLLLPVALFGCSYGEIQVDQPEVFTRERILRLRQADHDFLMEELDRAKSYTLEFQGIQDTRTFTGIYNSLRGGYDPVTGQVAEAELLRRRQAADRSESLQELDHEIEVERRRRTLEEIRAGGELPEATAGASASGELPRVAAPGQGEAPFGARPELPDPSQIQTTQAKLTSQERLNETMAYRESIQALLLEKQLDDTHDLHGFTLYTLKFDISVLPREHNGALGRVVLEVDRGRILDLHDELQPESNVYQRWITHLNARMRSEQRALETALLDGVSDAERRDVMRALAPLLESLPEVKKRITGGQPALFEVMPVAALPDATPARADLWAKPLLELVGQIADKATRWEDLSQGDLRLLAACAVAARYSGPPTSKVAMHRYCDFYVVRPTSDLSYVDARLNRDGKEAKFLSKVEESLDQDHLQPYVYAIQPKLHAQNISRVAAQETVLNLMATVSASLTQLAVEDSAQYVKRSQELLSAINRKTKASGFIDGKDTFGWVLGPRFYLRPKTFLGFEIDEVEAAFEHVPAQYSYSATLAVPALLTALPLKGHFEWLDRFGNVLERAPLFRRTQTHLFNATDYDLRSGRTVVRLPGPDFDAYTASLFAEAGADPTQPSIQDYSPNVLQAGGDTSVVIRGENLWRNPEVYLAEQRATRVHILPDMRGVRAEFKELALPARLNAKSNPVVDLVVITSYGSTRVPLAVTILPKDGSAETPPTAKPNLETRYVVGRDDLVLTVPASLIPDESPLVVVEVSEAKSNVWVALGATAQVTRLDSKTKRVVVNLDYDGDTSTESDDNFPWKNGTKTVHTLQVRFRVQPSASKPLGDPHDVEQTFVFFVDKVRASAIAEFGFPLERKGYLPADTWTLPVFQKFDRYSVDGVASVTTLSLENATALFQAHPGLESALFSGECRLRTAGSNGLKLKRPWLNHDTKKNRVRISVLGDEDFSISSSKFELEPLRLQYGSKASQAVPVTLGRETKFREVLVERRMLGRVPSTLYQVESVQNPRLLRNVIVTFDSGPLGEIDPEPQSAKHFHLSVSGSGAVLQARSLQANPPTLTFNGSLGSSLVGRSRLDLRAGTKDAGLQGPGRQVVYVEPVPRLGVRSPGTVLRVSFPASAIYDPLGSSELRRVEVVGLGRLGISAKSQRVGDAFVAELQVTQRLLNLLRIRAARAEFHCSV
ncbi:MAG: hypothetical protein R3F62_16950 [Planctomycetota bacterium]